MNFKLTVLAAVLVASGVANAAIDNGASGNGELFFNAWDGTQSYTRDLNLSQNAFEAAVAAPGSFSQSWTGDALFSTFLSTANLATLQWNIFSTEGVGARKFTAANGAGGLIVVENASSGNVASCLTAAVNGGVYTTSDRDGVPVTVDFGTGGYKAIGVLSMDSLASSTAASKWQFRSLDGAGKVVSSGTAGAAPTLTGTGRFPTLDSLMTGDWDLQGWVSFNVPSRTAGNAAKADALAKFASAAQDPVIIGATASLKQVAAAVPGGAYSGAQVLNVGYVNNNQCAPLNRNF